MSGSRFPVAAPRVIQFENVVLHIALAPSGEIVVLSYAKNALERVLSLLSPGGEVLWSELLAQESKAGIPRFPTFRWPCRVGEDGYVWVGFPDKLCAYDLEGRLQRTISVTVEDFEQLGTFLLAQGGIAVALGHKFTSDPARLPWQGRVVFLNPEGGQAWETKIGTDEVSFSGIRMGDKPYPPWRPSSWLSAYSTPIVQSNDALLVSYYEESGGLARSYCLDADFGEVRWTTEARPQGHIAVAASGDFLLGASGYGAFVTEGRSREGELLQSWNTYGQCTVDPEGRTCVSESGGRGGLFVRLKKNGKLEKGPRLERYYSAYPVMNSEGTAFQCRNGELASVDKNLVKTVLYQGPEIQDHGDSLVMTRMLLTSTGIAVGVDKTVLLFTGEFGTLAHSAWPCGLGNARGNPVVGV